MHVPTIVSQIKVRENWRTIKRYW